MRVHNRHLMDEVLSITEMRLLRFLHRHGLTKYDRSGTRQMFSCRMGRSFTNYSGGVLISEFLWEKRKIKRGISRFVVKVIIKIISICIHMRLLQPVLSVLMGR